MKASLAAEPSSLSPIANPPVVGSGHAGPGWFDSSWELRSGLLVEEGLPADLALQGWLEVWSQIVGGGAAASLSLSAT